MVEWISEAQIVHTLQEVVMRGFALSTALAFLAACGGPAKGPDTPKVHDNADATHRVDVLPRGHGSAVVVDAENGILLTCHHVVGEGRRELVVNIAVDEEAPVAHPAKVIAWDKKNDLALIKVERRFERSVVLAELDEIHMLDDVYNIGFPYDFGELGSKGVIKSIDYDDPRRGLEDVMLVEIDGVPGTSGSGVFLVRDGKLVGLMSALIPVGPDDGRRIVVRVVIRIDVIRRFLDGAKVRYRTSPLGQGEVMNVGSGMSGKGRLTIGIPPPSR